MAGSILDALSKDARIAYPFIQRGVREGLSANSIGRALSSAGLKIRRQALLDLVRLEKGVASYGDVLRSLSARAKIDVASLPEAVTTIRRGAAFVVEIRGRGIGGETVTQHVTVSTDAPALERGAIESIARDLGVRGKDRYGLDVESVTVIRGIRAGAAGTFADSLS